MSIKRLAVLSLALLLTFVFAVTAAATESGETDVENSVTESVAESVPVQSSDVVSSEESTAPSYDFTVSYGYDPLEAGGATASNYVKGKTPDTAYLKAGDNYTVSPCYYTFRDYEFAGWKYGNKIYHPGDIIYNVQNNITLKVTWRRPKDTAINVVGVLGYEGEDGVHVQVGKTVTLKAGRWQEADGRIFEGGSAFLMSFGVAAFKPYSGTDSLVSVSYSCGVSNGVQSAFKVAAGAGFRVDNCFGQRSGYKFVGYKDQNGKVYQAGDTCIATGDVVFTAQWQEQSKPAPDYCSVTLTSGEGGSFSLEGKTTVEKGGKIEFNVRVEDGYELSSVTCNGEELGTGGNYVLTVNSDMVIKSSFKYVKVEDPSSEASDSESASESVSIPPVSSESEVESTSPAESGVSSNDGDDSEGDKGGKGVLLVVAILVCVICLCGGVWFISRSMGKKNAKRRKRK